MARELLGAVLVEPALGLAVEAVSLPGAAFVDRRAPSLEEVIDLLDVRVIARDVRVELFPAAIAAIVFDAANSGRGVAEQVYGTLTGGDGPWLDRLDWAEWPFPRTLPDLDLEGVFRSYLDEAAFRPYVPVRNSPLHEESLASQARKGAVAGVGAGGGILVASKITGATLLIIGGPVLVVAGVAGGAAVMAVEVVRRRYLKDQPA